tara:strand:+ start:1251 stop:1535 length:285 start_codon:yes stop_codon:yes gene_type:complete
MIVWSPEARRDLLDILDYISADDPAAAMRVLDTIEKAVSALSVHPRRGRPGRRKGTRELVLPDLPYFVPYRLHGTDIEIARILHTARRWPDAGS